MARHGWRSSRSVEQRLYADPHAFNFFQAVRLLELLNRRRGGPMAGALAQARRESARKAGAPEAVDPAEAAVRFAGTLGLAFPSSDIAKLDPSPDGRAPARMAVTHMSLSGAMGPLPLAYTELINDRIRRKDHAARDFLDLFVHRLVALFYRIRRRHRIGFSLDAPGRDHFAQYLFSLMGLGTGHLQGRMAVPDRALLPYAPLFNRKVRSLSGLVTLLSGYFDVKVRAEPFIGGWIALAPDERTVLGKPGQGRNDRLGRTAVLGARVWDQQGRLRLVLGPMGLDRYRAFLPGGAAHAKLRDLVRLYCGSEFEADARFIVAAAEVPATRLSAKDGARLGWTSWVKTASLARDDGQARLSLTLQAGPGA